jgi:hypothetical protein
MIHTTPTHLLDCFDFTLKKCKKKQYNSEYLELMFDEFKEVLIAENDKLVKQNNKILEQTGKRMKKKENTLKIVREPIILEF